jgi:hypothetical protein
MLPDSFQPYLLNAGTGGNISLTTSGTTDLLTKGQLGIFTCPPQTGVYGSAISAGTSTPCIIASGSWHTVDQISPLWGGLQEPDYTQIIDWRRVNAFIYTQAQSAQNQVVSFGWNQTTGSTVGPAFFCGTSYQFQLEISGNPALNFLNHQYYKSVSAFSGCCSNGCTSGCTTTYVDAGSVLLQWKDQFNQDPYWPSFINPQVFIQTSAGTALEIFSAYDVTQGRAVSAYTPNTSNPQSVVAGLKITVAYVQTTFGTCTFSPTDHYEVEPLYLQGSLFTQDANPCAVNTTIDTSVPTMFTEITAPRQVRGIGQTVARNLIQWNRYKQEDFPDSQWVGSLRMREIENDWVMPNVSLSGLYDTLYLKFNIFRPYNTQSITDNDEYALTIYVPTGTNVTAFTSLVNSCLTASGNFVQLVTI